MKKTREKQKETEKERGKRKEEGGGGREGGEGEEGNGQRPGDLELLSALPSPLLPLSPLPSWEGAGGVDSQSHPVP